MTCSDEIMQFVSRVSAKVDRLRSALNVFKAATTCLYISVRTPEHSEFDLCHHIRAACHANAARQFG